MALTPKQWEKFRRHVQPGTRIEVYIAGRTIEGVLLENWPYADLEAWISFSGPFTDPPTEEDIVERDSDPNIRYQPFGFVDWALTSMSRATFDIGGKPCKIDDILQLPDTQAR